MPISLDTVRHQKQLSENPEFTRVVGITHSTGLPVTELERKVGKVWQEVFGFHQIDPHDNFFDLGGESLLALQVISRLRDALGVNLPLRIVFDFPTVAELASVIAQFQQKQGDSDEIDRILREIEQLSPKNSE